MSNYNKINKLGTKVSVGILSCVAVMLLQVNTVYGAEDPTVGTANDDIENMIEVGKSLINQTPYVYGGGHSDWDEQKDLEVPTGLDNSSYVAWVLYRGMGVDIGLAPIAGNYDQYFDTISVGSLEGVQRGDLIADDRHVEIYLGQSEDDGKHYSLTATNDRNNVDITETNWGAGVETKEVIRPSIEYAKTGKNGLTYEGSVVLDGGIGEGAIGGTLTTKEGTDAGTTPKASNGTRGDSDTPKDLVEDEDGEESEDEESNKGNTKGIDEDLFSWLNPIVDFSGASNTHSKSNSEGKRIDGNNKGLKGHQKSLIDSLF